MQNFTYADGGVVAAKGFMAGGVHCGLRKNRTKRDLALIYSETPCNAAAVYTLNKVKGAPIEVTRANLADGIAQAVICNSGNANTCNADGIEIAEKTCYELAKHLKIKPEDVIIASTGVIGQSLNVQAIIDGIPALVESIQDTPEAADNASEAIMTTDLAQKEFAVSFMLDSGCESVAPYKITIGGMAKGSGMINPNMATMLCFITTDCNISSAMLNKALRESTVETFNMVSVDGDTSTNDMVSIMANGQAGNKEIVCEGGDYDLFLAALNDLNIKFSRSIARDGEGATKLLECKVSNADTLEDARKFAKSVISSSLFKAAMFGADANWGRVLCALGYADAEFDPNKVSVAFSSVKGKIHVCKDGAGLPFDEAIAKEILLCEEILIDINMGCGSENTATAWGCDLTYDYVKINGDYRS